VTDENQPSPTDRITVLLADDHALVRRGFRRLLEDDPELAVVGEASNGDEAIALAARLSPHVIVMDVAMPGTSGLAALKVILEQRPAARILMLSMHSEETLVRQALSAGACGYVLKNALDLDLSAAVKKVAAAVTSVRRRSCGGSEAPRPRTGVCANASGAPSRRNSRRFIAG
jgi:DNA-binding NarL/FixJ family response regulator